MPPRCVSVHIPMLSSGLNFLASHIPLQKGRKYEAGEEGPKGWKTKTGVSDKGGRKNCKGEGKQNLIIKGDHGGFTLLAAAVGGQLLWTTYR